MKDLFPLPAPQALIAIYNAGLRFFAPTNSQINHTTVSRDSNPPSSQCVVASLSKSPDSEVISPDLAQTLKEMQAQESAFLERVANTLRNIQNFAKLTPEHYTVEAILWISFSHSQQIERLNTHYIEKRRLFTMIMEMQELFTHRKALLLLKDKLTPHQHYYLIFNEQTESFEIVPRKNINVFQYLDITPNIANSHQNTHLTILNEHEEIYPTPEPPLPTDEDLIVIEPEDINPSTPDFLPEPTPASGSDQDENAVIEKRFNFSL